VYADGAAAPAFGACSGDGAHTASDLAPGTYRFEVVALDAAGNEDPSPAARSFTVEAAPSAQPEPEPQPQPHPTADPPGGSQGGDPLPVTPKPARQGKCAVLHGSKRARCIHRSCAKLKKRRHGAKRYRACVKAVTRKA
jgi:hypothetical protein